MHKRILLGHGSGGKLMHNFIRSKILKKLSNPILDELSDGAVIKYKEKFAFSTDSFVVSPIFFPGADIGKLSVCGTVNDLVMMGAVPEYLSLAFIIEEGLEEEIVSKIIDSVSLSARKSKVKIVTGDFKVVQKGEADKIFINTSGIGRIVKNTNLSLRNISVGDKVIVTGAIGYHGMAVLSSRHSIDLGFSIKSDCAALNSLLLPVLNRTQAVKFMRDPTRGGLATTLNEISSGINFGIEIDESRLPIPAKILAASELLGMDPLYLANEGMAVLIADKKSADRIVMLLRNNPLGRGARIIGEIVKTHPKSVIINTKIGTQRILDMLVSESLPRIC